MNPSMKIKRKSRTRSEVRTRRRDLLRKTVCLLLLLLCVFPMLGGNVQPLWVIPAAVFIAMHEDYYFVLFTSVIAGLSIDLSCGTVLGANAIYTVCFCTGVTLLFSQLLRPGFFHFLWLTALCAFLRAGLQYLLTAAIFRADGREALWMHILLPSAAMTVITAIIVYLLYLPCTKLLTKRVRSMDAAAIRRDW